MNAKEYLKSIGMNRDTAPIFYDQIAEIAEEFHSHKLSEITEGKIDEIFEIFATSILIGKELSRFISKEDFKKAITNLLKGER